MSQNDWPFPGTVTILDWSTFIPEGDPFILSDIDRSQGLPVGTTELHLMSQNCVRKTAIDNYRAGRYRKAYRLFKKCFKEYRDPRSLTCLGYLFENGKGVHRDFTKAMTCYIHASEKFGDPVAGMIVSQIYAKNPFYHQIFRMENEPGF